MSQPQASLFFAPPEPIPANIGTHEMYDRTRNHPESPSRGSSLRRNPHSRFVFRLFLGVVGAALVLLPLALPQSWIVAIAGLVLFMTSILLPSVPREKPATEPMPVNAEQLILTGAEYSDAGARPTPVKLMIGPEQLLAVKPNAQPAVAVPLGELHSVFLQRSDQSWLLVLESATTETVFSFHGVFAERNSRKAESVIRRFAPVASPEKPKAQAARA